MFTKLFKPKSYIKSVYQLDLRALVQDGYKLILCDIDNTLVGFKEPSPPEAAIDLFRRCNEAEIKIILVSNNKEKRVVPFAQVGGVECYFFSLKPFKKTYQKILQDTGLQAKEVVCIGDQILTDVLGGNRMGMHTIFCDCIVDGDSFRTKVNRFFERIILTVLSSQNKWEKGEYYGYKM